MIGADHIVYLDRENGRATAQDPFSAMSDPFHISLSAFFTWASREFGLPNPIKAVHSPKFQEAPIEPFSQEEVELWLKACEFSVEIQPGNTTAPAPAPTAPARTGQGCKCQCQCQTNDRNAR